MKGYVAPIDRGQKWSGWLIGMTIFGIAYQTIVWSMPTDVKSANDTDLYRES